MSITKPQIRELRTLKIGQEFKVWRLEEYYRNLVVLFINDSCVTLKGEYLEEGKWKSLGSYTTMSCRTEILTE